MIMSGVAKMPSSKGRGCRLICAASLVTVFLMGCGSEDSAEEQVNSNSSAMCPASLILNGVRYHGHHIDTAVTAKETAMRAKIPQCNDTNRGEPLPARAVKVWTIPGVEVASGFTTHYYGSHAIFVRKAFSDARIREVIEKAEGQ